MNAHDICDLAPVIPVLVVEDTGVARPLAEALVAGGLPALEVTLRTPRALEIVRQMADVAGGVVGAGTLLTADDVRAAVDAGARFGVSPGAPPVVLDTAEALGLPMLPGVATPTEAIAMLERGLTMLKFFPAGPAGGPAMLKALASPLPNAAFCPTGGVSLANAGEYLALPNVRCVGGSWVAPPALIAAGDWAGIEALARAASGLVRG